MLAGLTAAAQLLSDSIDADHERALTMPRPKGKLPPELPPDDAKQGWF